MQQGAFVFKQPIIWDLTGITATTCPELQASAITGNKCLPIRRARLNFRAWVALYDC